MSLNDLLPPRWGRVSQLFHWISAAVLVAVGAIGVYMTELTSPVAKIRIYALHKSLGLTLLGLVVLRLLWRWTHAVPDAVAGTSRPMRLAADGMHGLLYLVMIAMPITGWLFNSAAGYPLQWFRLFNLPALSPRDEQLRDLAHALHEYGFWLLVVLVAGHVLAALYHHLFLNDGTLHRMLPWRRRAPAALIDTDTTDTPPEATP